MRLVFCGSPAAAVPSLRALVADGHEVALVVTRPAGRRGRGGRHEQTAVGAAASELGLAVSDRLTDVLGVDAELGVVVAYGALIPPAVLNALPMLNVHFSLLPRWRGAAPVERAILAGDRETGVCVMGLEPTLDTGPVYARRTTEVGEKDAQTLTDELAFLGAAAVRDLLRGPLPTPEPQTGEATYAKKITAGDLVLSPAVPASQLARIVRLGRASAELGGTRVRVRRAHATTDKVVAGAVRGERGAVLLGTTDGALAVTELTPPGGRSMDAAAWWRSHPVTAWSAAVESQP